MCRIFACLMVVFIHVSASGWYIDPTLNEWRVFNLFDMAVRPGVPLFFMISGVLFLGRDSFNVRKFIINNIMRLVFIYFIWSAIYELMINGFGSKSFYDFLLGTINGYYHLWFLPAMIVVYLFVPIVYSAINGERMNPRYTLVLFLIFTILTTNLLLFFNDSQLVQWMCSKLNISYLPYMGYMVLGYILSKKNLHKKVYIFFPSICYFLVTILSAYANRRYSLQKGEATAWLYGDFCIPVFIQACCVFIFFQYFKGMRVKHPKVVKYVSDCTLGIYLLHPMVIKFLNEREISVSCFNPVLSVPCISIVVISMSFLITGILKAVPLIRKTVS